MFVTQPNMHPRLSHVKWLISYLVKTCPLEWYSINYASFGDNFPQKSTFWGRVFRENDVFFTGIYGTIREFIWSRHEIFFFCFDRLHVDVSKIITKTIITTADRQFGFDFRRFGGRLTDHNHIINSIYHSPWSLKKQRWHYVKIKTILIEFRNINPETMIALSNAIWTIRWLDLKEIILSSFDVLVMWYAMAKSYLLIFCQIFNSLAVIIVVFVLLWTDNST